MPNTQTTNSRTAAPIKTRDQSRDASSSRDALDPKQYIVDRLSTLNEKLKNYTPQILSTPGTAISEKVSQFSSYIEDNDPKDVLADVAAFMKRHPLPFIFGSLGIGLGVLMSTSNGLRPKKSSHANVTKNLN